MVSDPRENESELACGFVANRATLRSIDAITRRERVTTAWIGGGCRERAAPGRRADPLGAQRRGVRGREDVLCGNRDVRVVRKSRVTRCRCLGRGQRDGHGDDRDRRGPRAPTEAGALRPVIRRRLRAGGALVRRSRNRGLGGVVSAVWAATGGGGCVLRPVHGARVRHVGSGRNGNEPEPNEQGHDTTPPRAPHASNIRSRGPNCHECRPSTTAAGNSCRAC